MKDAHASFSFVYVCLCVYLCICREKCLLHQNWIIKSRVLDVVCCKCSLSLVLLFNHDHLYVLFWLNVHEVRFFYFFFVVGMIK